MQFEGIKHEHRSIILEELRILSPTRSVLQTTGNRSNRDTASVLTVCWDIPVQCLTGTFQTQFIITDIILPVPVTLVQNQFSTLHFMYHVQHQQGQDQE